MFTNKLRRPFAALAVTAGLLAVAGPASASNGQPSNGHAGPDATADATAIKSVELRSGGPRQPLRMEMDIIWL